MSQWWIIVLIGFIISIFIGLLLILFIRFLIRNDQKNEYNEFHKKNNSHTYWDELDGKHKQDNIPFINIPNDPDMIMKTKILLEMEANNVREGLRSSQFFKKAISRFREANQNDEITLNINRGTDIMKSIEKSIIHLKKHNIDISAIEDYIVMVGQPEDW